MIGVETKAGDDRFEQLYRGFYGSVFRLFVRMGFTQVRAQDLTQETFIRVYEHAASYRGEGEWRYLELIARRIAMNHVRSFHSAKRSGVEIALDDPFESDASIAYQVADRADPAAEFVQKESAARLREAIAELPEGAQQTLRLYLQGLTYEEIGRAMRVTVDAVKSRLKDAKRILREKIRRNNDSI
jgi:RNA polymerase sigma-70 factor (ECF subfamily)